MTGKEFRKWRRYNDITQEKVSKVCNIDESIISRWERDLMVITADNHKRLLDFVDKNTNNNDINQKDIIGDENILKYLLTKYNLSKEEILKEMIKN